MNPPVTRNQLSVPDGVRMYSADGVRNVLDLRYETNPVRVFPPNKSRKRRGTVGPATGLTGIESVASSMRKTELLHLHSLFGLLQRYFEREGAIDGPIEEYESMDVRPTHAHKPKDRHREAVIALASGIADEHAKNSKYADDGEQAGTVTADG